MYTGFTNNYVYFMLVTYLLFNLLLTIQFTLMHFSSTENLIYYKQWKFYFDLVGNKRVISLTSVQDKKSGLVKHNS